MKRSDVRTHHRNYTECLPESVLRKGFKKPRLQHENNTLTLLVGILKNPISEREQFIKRLRTHI